ncbi:nuclear transport factor 2 family protein [Mycolicibacterium thermoresistibile]
MSAEENIETIKRGYEAFAAGDMETVLSLFDDDMEWVQPGDSAISGTYHGKAEFMDFLGKLGEKGATVKVNRLIADGDTVVALTDVTLGGESARDADVFTMRDGKTVHAEIYTDTAMMERIYGKKQVASA